MSDIDISCYTDSIQKFLVCVTVHKATKLSILNADTFVIVSLNDILKRTSVIENSDCPYFNEYFVYDLECSLHDLLKKSLTFRVLQRKCLCRKNVTIGEVVLDLSTVWDTPSKLINPIRAIHC